MENFCTWFSDLYAATAILSKVGVAGINSNLATLIRTVVVEVVASLSLIFLVLSGVATALSWLCYFRALQMAPVSSVAPIDKLSIVFVILFAAIFLKEALTIKTAAGAVLIVSGVLPNVWNWSGRCVHLT